MTTRTEEVVGRWLRGEATFDAARAASDVEFWFEIATTLQREARERICALTAERDAAREMEAKWRERCQGDEPTIAAMPELRERVRELEVASDVDRARAAELEALLVERDVEIARLTARGSRAEMWAPVLGLEAKYEVSTLGRIASLETRRDKGLVVARRRLLAGHLGTHGYRKWSISIDGRRQERAVHVAVLEAFDGPRPEGHDAAHLNGNAEDNRLVNLAWVTRAENMGHKRLHGSMQRGEQHPSALLTDDIVRTIRKRRRDRVPIKVVAAEFGIGETTVSEIALRKRWQHVD
jgi:hypothetical protein